MSYLAYFLYNIGPSARGATAPSWLEPPIPIINQENTSEICVYPNLMEAAYQLMSPFSNNSSLCLVNKN